MSKLVKIGEEWVHPTTGEVFTKKKLETYNDQKFLEAHNEYMINSSEHGLDSKYGMKKVKLSETSNRKTVKEGYKFNMVHRTDVKRLLSTQELTVQELAFIGALSPFITHPDNDVKIDGKYLSLEELGKFCGISKNIVSRTIKNLEKLEVIKVVKGGNKPPIIYFNPFLYAAGRDVSIDTYNLFCKSQYNPDFEYYLMS